MAGTFVIVPTFNEVENVTRLIAGVLAESPEARVIVVDDASPDGTADAVERLADPRVAVLRRPGKNGLGAAYRAGFAAALERGASICVQMDADLSHDPRYLPELVSVVERGADASIGSRYVPGGACVDWPRLRQFLSRWGNRYAAGMLGLAVNDATSGFRAYSAATLARMDFGSVTAEGYGFQVEMTHRLVRCGARVVEIPIVFPDRTAGESKLTHRIIGEAFRLVLRLAWSDWRRGHRRRL
ncbi:MAG: dolichyl-phosphate beta-D-mannosyltransferase [Acidimicrobiales bacterium mtb01]|nr:polyprenol monophosphomannose synthase [Actinomycetota bacterium]TEX44988.1 MAG: dolichyl-phosphate beta-D-mannosyltransferase [Acidimicrobiales bacterium mtb01]